MTTIEAITVELLETSSVQALSYRYRLLTNLIAIIMGPCSRDEETALRSNKETDEGKDAPTCRLLKHRVLDKAHTRKPREVACELKVE